jgi:pimeloyl-ACP methyl ester carboxylesterase
MIHALPGMGADRRMYPEDWKALPKFVAHDWFHHAGEKTVAEVARSMVASCNICDGDVLIGSSMGGIVACEITKIRNIPRLYLVGSAVSKNEISGLFAALHPLAKVTPIEWLRISSGSVPMELTQMFASADASFIRAMCGAIFTWDGLGDTKTQVVRVHGRFDLVIPPPKHVDLFIDGGHLIAMSHAQECADFIRGYESTVVRT